MDDFTAEPDEGYSEDPLNPTTTQAHGYPKPRSSHAVSALTSSSSTVEFSELTRHIASLSVHDKTRESSRHSSELHTLSHRD